MGDIDTYNGHAIVAMAGKDCVAIAADKRLGVQMQTVATNFKKIFQINDRIMLGLAGLATDILTVHEKLRYDTNLLELREERPIDAFRFKNLVKSLLYEHRFAPYFTTPVIAGLTPDNKPYLATSDSIGAFCEPDDFAVAGTCTDSLYGVCESFWRPDMNADELFEVTAKCITAAIERDSIAGWGAVVYIMTPEEIIVKEIKTRMD